MTNTLSGPFKKFLHGAIHGDYFNYDRDNLNFIVFGNVEIIDVIVTNNERLSRGDTIVGSANIRFNDGLVAKNVMCDISQLNGELNINPRIQSLWYNMNREGKFKKLVESLKKDAERNKAIYHKVTTDSHFPMLLVSIGIPKEISMHELFNDERVKALFTWKHKIGFAFNDLVMHYEIAGRDATNELIEEYIESEKVYRTDCTRDKIDDALLLMNKNGELSERQFELFYKCNCRR